ncbi:hypothetical protein HN018_25485 (plasmid) [Lichenicola cladoniae]|uniref:Uncharacterized protein n=1 Tax=Lichenicola cladoniae TaxID=1484109 RepID=A0A6M8HZ30_9PROT|nr:hypothetical protein [Lichenicola cladoniae]NPD66786.1 hypothetical protein [Acetobacteraceae bacterium]QKE93516.1 hypothetical protein HN018_25485 [Lichenicola cladoniae]
MAAPSYVFTFTRVARVLGEDEDSLKEIAMQMDPEDGRLCVIDLEDDVSTTVLTAFGIENPTHLLDEYEPHKTSE